MTSRIMSLAQRVFDRIEANRDPVKFAKRIGVRIRGDVKFYGVSRAMFGSEPWMIGLGDRVFITAECRFVTHDGGTLILRREVPDLEWSAPIEVGDDVYIGTRSLILPGVTIGNRVVIGACSVVTKDVPENTVVAGNPARRICSVDEYLERMKKKSLGLGHLAGAAKDAELRKLFAHLFSDSSL